MTEPHPYDPDSPLAQLMEIAAAAIDEVAENEEREAAEAAAAHLVYRVFTCSLALAVTPVLWQGYPAVRERGVYRWEGSAVAYLGGGLWLHHTLRISETDKVSDVLTLVVPCTCACGYVDIVLGTEEHLIEILMKLRPTYGRSPHDGLTPDCRSVQLLPQ
ncbi:hypothetical protein [Streptomyces sp. NPDC055210]